jgi:hypothetical protein
MTPARFPHSDTPGSTLGCQLPRAYRRLLRPSSALDAKASTMCPSQLVTHTTNPTPPNRRDQASSAHTTHTQHTTHRVTHTAEVFTRAGPHQQPPHHRRPEGRAWATRHKRTAHPRTINRECATNNATHPTPTTHPHHTVITTEDRRGAEGQQGTAAKMLASTIQISNNNPTPTHTPHPGGRRQAGNRSPNHHPRPPGNEGFAADSSEPQQRVCQPQPPPPPPAPHPDTPTPITR